MFFYIDALEKAKLITHFFILQKSLSLLIDRHILAYPLIQQYNIILYRRNYNFFPHNFLWKISIWVGINDPQKSINMAIINSNSQKASKIIF